MTKQLVLSLFAGLLISLPGCGCKDSCDKKSVDSTETTVDAQTETTLPETVEISLPEVQQETEAPTKF